MIITELSEKHKFGTNQIIGDFESFENSKITFSGNNNTIICGEKVKFEGSTILFKGDNALVFLGSNKYKYKVNITMNDNNVLFIGKNCFFNQNVHFVLAEYKHIFIGNNCMFSRGIWLRTTDAHPIYDANNKKRVNNAKSIFLGDHVWLGQEVLILKGTKIDSGSIIGAKSLVSNKTIKHNEIWGGVPPRLIKKGIFWDDIKVYDWNSEEINKYQLYNELREKKKENAYCYKYNSTECLSFDVIDNNFSKLDGEKLRKYVNKLYISKEKNRFVHTIPRKSIKSIIKRVIHKTKKSDK